MQFNNMHTVLLMTLFGVLPVLAAPVTSSSHYTNSTSAVSRTSTIKSTATKSSTGSAKSSASTSHSTKLSSTSTSTGSAKSSASTSHSTKLNPTSTSTASVQSSTAVSDTSSSGTKTTTMSKRGYPFNNLTNIQTLAAPYNGNGSKLSWAYNWNSAMPTGFPSSLEYVPMLWGDAPIKTKTWFADANYAIQQGSTHLLSFNEPDNAGQSNMTPAQAAASYQTWMMPYAGKVQLGSPAITNADYTMTWLSQFLGNCTSCQIDFIPVHWYNEWNNEAYFGNYMGQAAKVGGGRPIWITEFEAFGTSAQQLTFFNWALNWLDTHASVARYAWFMAAPGNTLNTAGNAPSAVGEAFTYTG